MFEDGIKEQTAHNIKSKWALNRRYFLSPINGSLKYHRLGNQERNNQETPFERASVDINDVNVTITEVPFSVFFIVVSNFFWGNVSRFLPGLAVIFSIGFWFLLTIFVLLRPVRVDTASAW